MSAPVERKTVPNPFRDQYAGGIGRDPELERLLRGAEPEAAQDVTEEAEPAPKRAAPAPAAPSTPALDSWFNQAPVKLR